MIAQVKYLKTWLCLWLGLKEDSHAVTALEYGMIAALIAVVIIVALQSVGKNLTSTFNTVAGEL